MINWKPYFETGIAVVDTQHKGLVDILNAAAPQLTGDTPIGPDEAAPLLDKLTEYAAIHFKTEDELMHAAGIDPRHYQHHRESHHAFVEQLVAMRAAFDRHGYVSGSELVRFLTGWLTFHILGEDQSMARMLKSMAQGNTAEQAWLAESNRQHDPAEAALTDSLVDLFAMMSTQNTKLNEANQHIARYRDHLEDLVRERAAELQRTNNALRESLAAAEAASRAKSRFLRTISHELLTPLNAISGFAHLLQNTELPAKASDQASKIHEASRTLTSQIHDVITYATLDSGGVKEKRAAFETAVLFAHLNSRFEAKAEGKGLRLQLDIDPTLPPLFEGDAAHLSMALEQYLRNAVHFTEQGHITLRARPGPLVPQLSDTFDTPAMLVRFEVQDTGPGIAPSLQPVLFHAFEQGDGSLTRRHQGMGLGLAIVAGLAKLLHGQAGVESRPQQGSTFWLQIPLHAAEALAETPPGAHPGAATLTELRQYLVQDDLRARQAFANLSPHDRAALGTHHLTLTNQLARFDFAGALQTLNEACPTCD